jgi:hypothetical protein
MPSLRLEVFMLASLSHKSIKVQSLCSVNPSMKQKGAIVIREKNSRILMPGNRS